MYLVPLSDALRRISWLEYVVLRVCFSSITNVCNQFRSKCSSAPQLKSIVHFLLVNPLIAWQIPSNKMILWPVEWKMTHAIKDSFRFISFRLSKFSNIIQYETIAVCSLNRVIFHKSASKIKLRLTYIFWISRNFHLALKSLIAWKKNTALFIHDKLNSSSP